MGATVLLARSAMRGRYRGHVALIALLIVGIGTALASFTAAWRTDHAYSDYLRRANVNPLVINPGPITDRLLELVRTTPGVESISMRRLLSVETDDIDPATQAALAGSTETLGVEGGEYIDVDRPTVVAGRMLAAPNEVFLNRAAADAFDLQIGDEISVTFMPTQPNGPAPRDLAPIGQERVTVVGVGIFADEVLPDELYSTLKVIFSPQLTAKYSCVITQPAADDARTLDELFTHFFPPDCASDATLLSLHLSAGDAGVDAVLAEIDRRLAAENLVLPAVMREENAGYLVIPTVTSVESDKVGRSLEPVVLALRLLGGAVLIATVVLTAAAAHRTTRDADSETRIWSQLGVGRSQRILAVAGPTAIATLAGLGGAVVAGWLTSGIGPVASVGVLDPSPSLGLPAAVVIAVVPGVLVLLLGTLAASAWRSTSPIRRRMAREATNRLAAAASRTGSVPLALGVHAAVRGRNRSGSGLVLAATAAAVAVVSGALVYSTNLAGLVSTPSRYGWTYDVGATINAGFDGADLAAIEHSLDRPEVAGWGVAATAMSATINGVKLPAVADMKGLTDLGMPVLQGTLPRNDHEIAIGSKSAERTGVSVGDDVTIETDYGTSTATVTGIVVLPSIGAFLSDRAAVGTGVLLAAPLFESIAGGSGFYDTLGGFVAVDLRDGVDPAQFVDSLGDGVLTWDRYQRPPAVHTEPVRPAQIADLASVKSAPLLLAGLIALTMVIGLVASLSRAIGVRRRELAICRALGCRGSQLYATLCWQAITVIAIGLVIGVPFGVAAGSTLWRRFASNLGIQPAPVQPLAWIGVVSGAAIAVSIAAALLPGRRAAAQVPAGALREGQ